MPKNLRSLILLIFIGLAIGPILLVGVVSGSASLEAIKRLGNENLQVITKQIAFRVEDFFDKPLLDIGILIKTTGIASQKPEKQKSILLSLMLGHEYYQALSLYDTSTSQLVSVSRTGEQNADAAESIKSFANPDNYQNQKEVSFGKVRFDNEIKEPLITMSFPIIDNRDGATTHVLKAELRFKLIWELLAGLNFQDYKEAYVTDSQGLVIAHANPSIVLKKMKVDVDRLNYGTGVSGHEVVLATKAISVGEEKLVIFVEQSVEEAEKTTNFIFKYIISVSLAALALSIFLYFYFSRQVVSPIVRLAQSTERVGHGVLTEHVDVSGFGEVGELIKVFNNMVSGLSDAHSDLSIKNVALNEEISKLEQAEKMTRFERDRAERANMAKSEFLSAMSHELRTPLTSSLGSLRLLNSLSQDDLTDQGKDLLEIALRNSDQLLRLINELLDYEKIISGSVIIETSVHDICSLTSKVIKDIQGYSQVHSVRFVLEDYTLPIFAELHEHRFEQVLNNLLSNAAKFSEPDRDVLISINSNKGFVFVSVKDCGPGIPEDFRDKIYDQFTQADSSSTRKHGGTGLGLTICKALMEGMGGAIKFETEMGVGTTFTISFPEASMLASTVT